MAGENKVKSRRCAIYTRKSTEEGLDQQFNSLDAQREACAAYILSQQHEGWELADGHYDDGGYSGGSMERPGLQRLLEEVRSGRIDVVVVYKVDRLTRSLADFAKIVEILDQADASFVSVTQAFNTTDSMGRLTLNVLLSFAQFEREVTAERIRDKIAASRKKGMWTGGPVPLGYDVVDRKLVVNESEAATVRLVFERHQHADTLVALVQDLEQLGIRTKRRICRNGRVLGDIPFRSGALRYLLGNPIYIGQVRHGAETVAGLHQAIVDPAIWRASQGKLEQAKPRPRTGYVSPLAGRIRDGAGRKLIAAHAIKGGKRYRYYVSKTRDAAGAWRLPAGDVEALVRRELKVFLYDNTGLARALGGLALSAEARDRIAALAERLELPGGLSDIVRNLSALVHVDDAKVEITLDRPKLGQTIGLQLPEGCLDDPHRITVPATLKRRGHELRLVDQSVHAANTNHDEGLIRLLVRGWQAWDILKTDEGLDETKRRELTRFARLRFLAPDVVTAILDGHQPVELTARKLMRTGNLPMNWPEQRQVLGFC